MSAIRRRTVIGERPAAVPCGWVIYNAPRPIYGDVEWRDGGGRGFFYAAVDPGGERAAWMAEENRRNDAAIFEYVSEDEAFTQGRARFIAAEGEEVAEIIDDPSNRQWVIGSYIDFCNRQS